MMKQVVMASPRLSMVRTMASLKLCKLSYAMLCLVVISAAGFRFVCHVDVAPLNVLVTSMKCSYSYRIAVSEHPLWFPSSRDTPNPQWRLSDVGNLSWDVDKEALADHFSQFGEVSSDIIGHVVSCLTTALPSG